MQEELKQLKKTFYRKNNILILSTNKGVVDTNFCVKNSCGGLILSKIWL